MRKNNFFFFLILLIIAPAALAQNHPHILVNKEDLNSIQISIETNKWARDLYNSIKEKTDIYVNRHTIDSLWILDRYLLNRIPGKRYINFISDSHGTSLIDYEGDAPVPTVRVSSHKRSPVTPQGSFYKRPSLEELTPNDTAVKMRLFNPDLKKYEVVDPQNYIGKINEEINKLAFNAAVLYWITREEKYGKFSADILNQWGRGAYYQNPIKGPLRTGFLDIQTLGDEASKHLILAYDFVYPYMISHNYDMSFYETVFEKIASTLAFRGYVNNNWYAAESSTMVAAALSLQDNSKRNFFLNFYLEKDTINNGCGQLALPSTETEWFTEEGHWKEPGGYHNYPVSKLIESAYMLEKNGIPVFPEYPILLKAAYAMLAYSFPDLTASSFGDTNRPKQDMYCLEIAIKMAQKYQLPILQDLLNAIAIFQEKEMYDRSKGGLYGLLCYLPTLPIRNDEKLVSPLWCSTAELDFASFFLQRNGMDKETGLMATIQGGTYNHNHSNGMAMELYGRGTVMGIDPGNGPTYEHPLHVEYYTQWAAHNTVVAGASSTSVSKFNGGGGTKDIGKVNFISREPLPKQKAVSSYFSYVYADYKEKYTNTNQQRLLSLIRTNDNDGYYLDIFYSDNKNINDYIYHNIGDNVSFYTPDGLLIKTEDVREYPQIKNDPPGFRYFKSVKTTGYNENPLVAIFDIRKLNKSMKMWLPAAKDRSYYSALAPKAKTAISPYDRIENPVIGIHTEKEALSNPFVVVYEPTQSGFNSGIIESVESIPLGKNKNLTCVKLKDETRQRIFLSGKGEDIEIKDLLFKGVYGIITESKEKTIFYIGEGSELSNENISVKTLLKGSVNVLITSDFIEVNTKDKCSIIFKDKSKYNNIVISDNKNLCNNKCIIKNNQIDLSEGNYKFYLNKK